MNSLLPRTARIEYHVAQRISRRVLHTPIEAFVICAPQAVASWQLLGKVNIVAPGVACLGALGQAGAPLVVDEEALIFGPWANTANAVGEGRLAEFESFAREISRNGGTVFGVPRDDLVPDVNLHRIRAMYDICIDNSYTMRAGAEPRIVRNIRTALDASLGTHND